MSKLLQIAHHKVQDQQLCTMRGHHPGSSLKTSHASERRRKLLWLGHVYRHDTSSQNNSLTKTEVEAPKESRTVDFNTTKNRPKW